MTGTPKFVLATAISLASALAAEEAQPCVVELAKPDDRATTTIEEGVATIAIRSPSGIGKATLARTGEAWPEKLTIRLHLKGLENFQASNGKVQIRAAVGSTGEEPRVRPSIGDDRALAGSDKPAYTATVRVLDKAGQPTTAIPLDDGWLEVDLPARFFEGNPKSITLEWIDFYRG